MPCTRSKACASSLAHDPHLDHLTPPRESISPGLVFLYKENAATDVAGRQNEHYKGVQVGSVGFGRGMTLMTRGRGSPSRT